MRVVTLEDKESLRALAKDFVLVTHNQLPELYCTSGTVDATARGSYPAAQMARVSEGAGGSNIRRGRLQPGGNRLQTLAIRGPLGIIRTRDEQIERR